MQQQISAILIKKDRIVNDMFIGRILTFPNSFYKNKLGDFFPGIIFGGRRRGRAFLLRLMG